MIRGLGAQERKKGQASGETRARIYPPGLHSCPFSHESKRGHAFVSVFQCVLAMWAHASSLVEWRKPKTVTRGLVLGSVALSSHQFVSPKLPPTPVRAHTKVFLFSAFVFVTFVFSLLISVALGRCSHCGPEKNITVFWRFHNWIPDGGASENNS